MPAESHNLFIQNQAIILSLEMSTILSLLDPQTSAGGVRRLNFNLSRESHARILS